MVENHQLQQENHQLQHPLKTSEWKTQELIAEKGWPKTELSEIKEKKHDYGRLLKSMQALQATSPRCSHGQCASMDSAHPGPGVSTPSKLCGSDGVKSALSGAAPCACAPHAPPHCGRDEFHHHCLGDASSEVPSMPRLCRSSKRRFALIWPPSARTTRVGVWALE